MKLLTRKVCASLVGLLVVGPVYAQSVIEEVTVRAHKVERALMDIPAAVGVVTIEDIQTGRQQLGLDESLSRIPGVFAQNRYNFAQDLRVAIRGFGARANFGIRGLKIYVDDLPATTPDGQSGVDDIDLGSLERIEVTRGPSSAIYGASSGGVLNLYSEAGPQTPYVQARVLIGEDDQQRYQVKMGGQTGAFNYMASLTDLSYDGYRANALVESTQFNSKLQYRFADGSDIRVILNAVDSPTAQDAGGITRDQADADPRQAQPRNLSSNAGEAIEQQRLGIVYSRPIGDNHQLKVRNYYVWRDFEAFLPIGTHIRFVADDGVVEFDRFVYGGAVQFDFNTELFGRLNQLSFGIEADIQKDDRQRYLNDAGVKGNLAFDQIERAEAYGVYLRNELSLSSALSLTVGLRYDDIELRVVDHFLTNDDQSSQLDFDELSPMLGLVWALNESASVYVNYATAFETPTFTELASPARGLSESLGGFNNVRAQEAESIEIGFKGAFLEGRLYLDAALFTMDVSDEISNVENIGNRAFFENADTDRRGLEVYLQAQLTAALRLSMAYTYSDFEFDEFPSSPGNQGNNLPGLPENQLFAELRYQHGSGFYLVADALNIGKLYANNANTVTAGSSIVANIRAGFELKRGQWQVAPFLGVNNIFDESYNTNLRINGFGGRLFEPAPGINLYAGFTLNMTL